MDSQRRGSSSLRSSITHAVQGHYTHVQPDNWQTRTWNDETAAALKADMEAPLGEVPAELFSLFFFFFFFFPKKKKKKKN